MAIDPRFTADPTALRNSVSNKWNKNPAEILPAWVADMDFPVAEPILSAVRDYVDRGFFGYGVPRLADEVKAGFVQWWSRFGLVGDVARTVIVTEIVQAMHAAVFAFTEPGDGVLVFTPVYPPFLGTVDEQKRTLVEHRLTIIDGEYRFDLEALRALIEEERPKVFLLCHPHNPVGRAWRGDELQTFAELAIEFDMVVVSDEIHADLVFAPATHIAFESLSAEAAARTITITSASKSFNTAGLRCAVMHFGSPELHAAFDRRVPAHLLGVAPVPGLLATAAAWNHGREWLDACVAVLDQNRRTVVDRLVGPHTGISGVLNQATYLQFLDFSALPRVRQFLDDEPGECVSTVLRELGGVALNDGPTFGSGLSAFARLNFGTSPELLEMICARIVKFAERMQ